SKLADGTKLTPLAPVILGLVPRIFWQQDTNLVNKLALLLNKSWFTQDSWDKPKNDWCRGRGFSMVISKQRSVAFCNKVMDTRLPQPAGCGDKYDVSSLCSRLLRRCIPRNDAVTNGEGWHRPWCDKILGTGPSMTGGRGAGFVRLLRSARNDAERNNIAFKGLDVVRQYAALLERRVQRGTRARKALVVTRQANPLGRSMIEMLGVLAIIAVLSVVGLDGFSKAMRMYRSAVQKETLEHLLANMVKIRNNLNHEVKTFENISYLFAAMGELPNGITFRDNRLYDKSGNSFTVYFGKNTWKTPTGTASSFEYHVRINWEQKDNSTSPTAYDSCINTLEVAKANSNEVKTVTQFIGNSEAFLSYDQSNISWKNMTVTQMNEVCKSCTAEKACSLVLYINP
ncbi:MAG: Tfp pilus assembly protein FimT/FimU, partial [Alphaproteobacteria bacterium]